MSMFGTVASSNFVVVNRTIMKRIGMTAAVMLAELADEEKFYEESGKLDNGWFFSTIENIEARTGIKRNQQKAGIKTLEEAGILICEKKGMPAKRYFKLVPDGLQKIFNGEPVCTKSANKNAQNQQTSTLKISEQERTKSADKFAENQPVRITYIKKNRDKDNIDKIYSRVEPDAGKVVSADVYEVINYLNERCHKHYRATSKSAQRYINARLKDGATVEEMKAVIDVKAAQWENDEKMREYLRPETLFNETKFESYRQQIGEQTEESPFDDVDLSGLEGKWRA